MSGGQISASGPELHDDGDAVAWTLGTSRPGEEPTSWDRISGPMTVAAAWRELGRLDLDDPTTADRLDGQDHWFRAEIPAGWGLDGPSDAPGRLTRILELDGLATIAEVWCNGEQIAASTSMFVPLRVDVTDRWRAEGNVLELRCRSLIAWLDAAKWPRPRWRTKLVPEQRLRNVRTTLLGRIPSWSPPVPPVGPFRAMRLRVVAGDRPHTVQPTSALPDLPRWYPWTHGEQPVLSGTARATTPDGRETALALAVPTPRSIEVDHGPDGDEFHLVVNGERVFCRGAVWMPIDPISARSTREQMRERLELAKAAGFNMLRISGTTWYEEPHFHELCDELGILVWQDLALANVDPSTDPAYLELLRQEVEANLPNGPSLAVVCGSSETEQQATMVGLGPDVLDTLPMRTHVPGWVAAIRPDVPYVPSTPTGGHLPFSVDTGIGHYYGVGAYLRPLTDARHARVTFAAESLAFANVPRPANVRALMNEGEQAPTHPRWKARVPRDRGVGWDFEDVRDHYVHVLFGVDPLRVRYGDPERYLALGRAAVADVMARTFAELRASRRSGGALVWTFSDLWDGAGWGIVDHDGSAKSPIGALRDVLAPVALFALDEGVNGVDLWVANDTAEPLEATLDVTQYRHGSVVTAQGSTTVHVPPRGLARHQVDGVLGRFSDPTGAYRFGPLAHDATAATLRTADGATVLARALHVPDGVGVAPGALGLRATAAWDDPEHLAVHVDVDRLARFVTIEAGHRSQSHDHVHVEPGTPLTIRLRYRPHDAPPRRGFVSALNGDTESSFTIPARPQPAASDADVTCEGAEP